MKEKIEEKLDERIELILNKKIEDVTSEEFMILSNKLSKIEFDEKKEDRDKELAEMIAKLFR